MKEEIKDPATYKHIVSVVLLMNTFKCQEK